MVIQVAKEDTSEMTHRSIIWPLVRVEVVIRVVSINFLRRSRIVPLSKFCMMSDQIQVVEVESHDRFHPLISSKTCVDTEKSYDVAPIPQALFHSIELVCSKAKIVCPDLIRVISIREGGRYPTWRIRS